MLSLKLFGGATIEGGDGAMSGPATHRHRLALLALLAASYPRGVPRENLMALLWPETGTTSARNLLNQAVYVLRSVLGERAIRTAGDKLHLDPTAAPCDVISFEEAASQGDLESAVNLYTAPFLDGFFLPDAPEFEHWMDGERDRLHLAYCRALGGLARATETQGDHTGAVEWWRRLNAADPYSAQVTLSLMRALEAAGDRAGAIRQAHTHAAILREEFDAAPHPEVMALAERIRVAPVAPIPSGDGEVVWRLHDAPPETGGSAANPSTKTEGALDENLPAGRGADIHRRDVDRPRSTGQKRLVAVGLGGLLLLLAGLRLFLWQPLPSLSAGSTPAERATSSVAVLPLKNYSGDAEQEYFADGMTEELITTLTKIEALRVIAHRSVMRFKDSSQPVPEIAQVLGVTYVVDGSVQQDGERVRITAHLIDAATNTPIWGERFERERHDVLALQLEVAEALAHEIEVTLTPEDWARLEDAPQVDPEAFELYVKGTQARSEMTAEAWRKAAGYFAQAIARDSAYAPAYAGLAFAEAYTGLSSTGDKHRARRWAETALELNPSLAEPYVVLGVIRQFYDWEWVGAEKALRQAIRLNPGYAEAHHELSMLLLRLGRFEEALREVQHAVYLSPLSSVFQHGLGQVYLFSGRYDEAARVAEKLLAAEPRSGQAHFLRGMAYVQQGRYADAEEAFEKCSELGRDCLRDLGYVYAVSGRRAEALEVLQALKERRRKEQEWLAGYDVAIVYAGLGEQKQALDWLERTVTPGGAVIYLGIHPWLRSLHAEPRFQAMLRKVGLDE